VVKFSGTRWLRDWECLRYVSDAVENKTVFALSRIVP